MNPIREALEAAAAKHEEKDETPVETGDSGSVERAGGDDSQPVDEAVAQPDATNDKPAVAADATEKEAAQRARDDKGRFAAAEKAAAAKKVVAVAPVVRPSAATVQNVVQTPPAESFKPPESWKPSAREHFAKLPSEVQAEVSRIDKEVRKVMQEAAPAKQVLEKFRETVGPYMGQIQAEGGDPFRAIGNLFQTSNVLRNGTPTDKATVVAKIIKQFGVPIEALDSALSGEMPPGGQQAPQFDPASVSRLVEEKLQARIQQATEAKAARSVEEFGSKNEFFNDVRPMMQALMLTAHQSGVAMTLEQAYKQACWANDEIRPLIQQREAAAAAKANPASTQQARAAASSLKSQPTGASSGGSKPSSIRQALEAAEAALSKR